jgi:FtsP/CotA-like multicopper oxidase with cupredoxin domain
MDGVTGALIIRSPDDPSQRHYDFDLFDHVIMLHDWLNQFTAERLPGPRTPPRKGQHPDAILINGRGARPVREKQYL